MTKLANDIEGTIATAMIALKQLAFSLAFATAAVAAAQYIIWALNGQP